MTDRARTLVTALCVFVASTGAALAVPITYTFSGTVSGDLNGAPFSNAAITITANGDTSTFPDIADCGAPNPALPCNALASVTFTIAGVGSGTITDPLFIFDNNSNSVLGLERVVGSDWLDISNAQFGTYGLLTAIGPLSVTPFGGGGSFGAVATTAGNLSLTVSPDTFQVTGGNAGVVPPTIAKAFGAASIPVNGSTSLTFTLNNPNASPLTGVGFTDTLPAGLVVATPNGLTGSCGGGTITATAGSGSVTLATATLAANTSCNFSVNVTGTGGGAKINTTGAVTSVEGGNGNTATASLTVVAPPTIAKSFGAASIAPNASTSLSFTLANPNASQATGVGFTDTLPAGLVIATPNGLTGSCGGGTITATAGSGSVSLAGATLAGNASCNFSVNVTATSVGTMINTTGAVTSVEGGSGGTATASITVAVAPVTVAPIPTLQAYALWLLAAALAIAAAVTLHRRRERD